MSDDDLDRVYELSKAIEEAVTALVNKMLVGTKSEVDYLIRTQLTENYRFWK